jgi:urease accessory protein UreF
MLRRQNGRKRLDAKRPPPNRPRRWLKKKSLNLSLIQNRPSRSHADARVARLKQTTMLATRAMRILRVKKQLRRQLSRRTNELIRTAKKIATVANRKERHLILMKMVVLAVVAAVAVVLKVGEKVASTTITMAVVTAAIIKVAVTLMPTGNVAGVVVEDVADEKAADEKAADEKAADVMVETAVKAAEIVFARWLPAQKLSKEQSTAFWNCILRDTDSLGTRRRVTSRKSPIRLCRVRLLRSITYVKES